MARANFYLLKSQDEESRLQFTCRLAEKAVGLGHRVFIRTATPEQESQLDQRLWSFRPESFLPHRSSAASSTHEAIVMGSDPTQADHEDVLINLSDAEIPVEAPFSRINEVIRGDESSLQHGRNRYKTYRDRGLELERFHI